MGQSPSGSVVVRLRSSVFPSVPQEGSLGLDVRGAFCAPRRASDRPVSGAWLHLLPLPLLQCGWLPSAWCLRFC